MPQIKCPTCGDRFYTATSKVRLTQRQRLIYDAIPVVARRTRGESATSIDLAAEVGWSQSTVWRELNYLEQIGEVYRPSGRNSGWAHVYVPVIKVEALAA